MAEAHALLRPIMQWQRVRHLSTSGEALYHLCTTSTSTSSRLAATTSRVHPRLTLITTSSRSSYQRSTLHLRAQALKLRDVPLELKSNSNSSGSDSDGDASDDSDGAVRKSRNEKKREARRAVRWAMELANLTPPQIKLIIRVTKLKPEVYDAFMLVKRLRPDVREGKRRQFNYIGKLLREVEPELLDELILATKVGDTQKLKELCGSDKQASEDGNEVLEVIEDEFEEEVPKTCISAATRWFEGLINKDVEVMNEIYSLNNVDFDRQELRRLVRKVHVSQERQVNLDSEEKSKVVDADVVRAERSLTRFLVSLAKQLPVE